MKKLVLASNNPGKIKEFQHILQPFDIELVPQSELSIEEVPETATTFVENALIKARHAAQQSGLPAMADDSGLIVDALDGEPGIYSARYAGEDANTQNNIDKLLHNMKGIAEADRTARFYCVIVLLQYADDPVPLICQGVWGGTILKQARGEGGFGYDPVFYVPEHDCSSAELSPEVKNRISHRARALNEFVKLFPTLPF